MLDLVPTAISLLDRLRIQADRIRQLGSELSVNISNLRSQVDVARDQANLVSIYICFNIYVSSLLSMFDDVICRLNLSQIMCSG